MNEKLNCGFGVRAYTHFKGMWSFGSCITHSFGETYLYINFAKWCICIGWLDKEEEK